MLIGYHCFSSVQRLYGYPVNFGIIPQKTAIYIFESMNICVGMFAFLSVYGLTKIFTKTENSIESTRMFIIKRLIKLFSIFIIPYIMCTSITLIFTDHNPYGKGINFIFNMVSDMLGLAGILGTPLMVGTWWYMSFAIILIIITPITIKLYDKYGWYIFLPFLFPVVFRPNFFSATSLTNMTRWLLTIPIGVIFAKENIFERLKNVVIIKNNIFIKIIKFLIMTLVLIVLIKFRTTEWSKEYVFYIISSVLPVFFICYLYEFIVNIPFLKDILNFLGKHSANIFFTHTFIRSIWLKEFTYSLINPIKIYGVVLILSIIISLAIELIKKLIRYEKIINFIVNKATQKCSEDVNKV